MPETELQKRLEQLGRRLVEDAEAWERSTRSQRRDVVSHLAAHISQQISTAIEKKTLSKLDRRATRRAERARRRAERRAQERTEASTAGGIVMLLAAVGMAAFAAFRPELWWLVFVALGIGLGGAKQLSLVAERKSSALPAPALPIEPGAGTETAAGAAPLHEVDTLCDQLLADLKRSPEAVQRFVQAPEKTIATLRATARALDTRRQQLLAEQPRERLAGLATQRGALEARLAAATDGVTRTKLGEALQSLDGQRSALEQLATYAERVDGEYTSLLVSLQELRTRVSVARSAGSAVQLDGVKHSVERLNSELEAISGALEDVSSGRLQPVAPVSLDEPQSATPSRARDRG
jgi:hypothetical protein